MLPPARRSFIPFSFGAAAAFACLAADEVNAYADRLGRARNISPCSTHPDPGRLLPHQPEEAAMTVIPQQLHDLLAGGHNVWVATVGADGMPNVSIKGSGALLDDEHLYFADMFSHKTRENIEHEPRVAVGIHDPERKVAMQVKGTAELIDHGEVFDQVNDKLKAISEQLHLPPMKYVVRITVESVWDMGPGPHAGAQLD
jgi:predicted pyridoxine 5'-phosphate oxidase superfamily flavin-nucleotide-binding protein